MTEILFTKPPSANRSVTMLDVFERQSLTVVKCFLFCLEKLFLQEGLFRRWCEFLREHQPL